MEENNQRAANNTTNFGIGFNYNPLFGGVGFSLNYSTTTNETSSTQRTIQQPAITSERNYAIEAAPPRHEETHAIEAAPRAYNNQSEVIAFYKNKVSSGPQGFYIETILRDWIGNYEQLDDFNNYIPWLFPNRKAGQNRHAPLLTDEDVEQICNSPKLKTRALKAFEIMLDFLGMMLKDSRTFALTDNYFERFKTIISPRTSMVITRILHFLIEINEEQLMVEWLKFFAKLIKEKKIDNSAKYSFNEYWINTLSDQDKEEIKNYIKHINK